MEEKTGKKFDEGKLRMGLLPPYAIEGLAQVLTYGANKYGDENWRDLQDAERRYMDALLRHVNAYMKGEENDPETGLSHLKHAMANLAFMIDIKATNNEH